MHLFQTLAQLFRGPPGPQGIPGLRGRTGDAGLDGKDAPLTLALGVVIVAPDTNIGWVPYLQGVIADCRKFWADLGITLDVTLRGIVSDLPPGKDVFDVLRLHHWQGTGFVPTVYVWVNASRVGATGEYLGETFGGGVMTAAGNVTRPGGATDLNEIIDHELGHALGLDHQEGSFMRAELETENRLVTLEQKAQVRKVAYKLGNL